MKKIIYFSMFLSAFLVSSCKNSLEKIEYRNDYPRIDDSNNIIDAHDGRVIRFGELFYWYGTRYGSTNGFTIENKYVVYSSSDLRNWKFENYLLPNQPEGVYYRPHVVYNNKTGKYILWYNWYPELWNGQFGVAVSNSPTGPFNIVNSDVPVLNSEFGVGDFGLFVDSDDRAYISYNTIQGHKVSIEQLSDDYLESSLISSGFIASGVEAGSMFKRDDLYYLLTDHTCCFCNQGSGARVYTSESVMGPYTYRQNINRYPGEVINGIFHNSSNVISFYEFIPSKGDILEVWFDDFVRIHEFFLLQFTGDRQGQCGEVDNPRVHPEIIMPTFKLEVFKNGEWEKVSVQLEISKKALRNIFKFNLDPVTTDKIRIIPFDTPNQHKIVISQLYFEDIQENYQAFKVDVKREGGRPIIPAQQTHVMELNSKEGIKLIWMGDLWGSATDNVKGHDYQFWSEPLEFYENGMMRPLKWVDKVSVVL